MKKLALVMVMLLSAGCKEQAKPYGPEMQRDLNVGLVNGYNDMQLRNAVVAQHTIFPYQFVDNSAELNELGQRDLAVLIEHFKANPGQLNIHQGATPAGLYHDRMQTILNRMSAAGIDMQKIKVQDAMAGGTGMPSERVILVLKKELLPPPGFNEKTSVRLEDNPVPASR